MEAGGGREALQGGCECCHSPLSALQSPPHLLNIVCQSYRSGRLFLRGIRLFLRPLAALHCMHCMRNLAAPSGSHFDALVQVPKHALYVFWVFAGVRLSRRALSLLARLHCCTFTAMRHYRPDAELWCGGFLFICPLENRLSFSSSSFVRQFHLPLFGHTLRKQPHGAY